MTESAPDPWQPPDPKPPPDPQQLPDPQQVQYPQYPTGPERGQPAANPRPIRARRVWAGIGLAFLGHVLALGLGIGVVTASSGMGSYFGIAFPLAELLVFVACLVVGIVQLVQGDRGIGVGLLVGWAAGAVILAGVCVALIVVVADALGG